jgi:3-hydroxyacyl-[acyl-carrier-protein] dehydratase
MREHADVRAILPHGPPAVLVDRVEWLEPGRSLRAVKAISGCEPCYQHLPAGSTAASYAYPASLVLESFGQAAALLWHSRAGAFGPNGDSVLMFAAARSCHFHGSAFPGDVLHHVVELEHVVAGTAFATGRTFVDDRQIASFGRISAVVRDASRVQR